jgi:hypothetical protein
MVSSLKQKRRIGAGEDKLVQAETVQKVAVLQSVHKPQLPHTANNISDK